MNPIAIVTDSACDLPAAALAEHRITAVPLVVRFGLEVINDGQLSLDEFWAKVAHSEFHPQTSQPPTGAFEAVFSRLVQEGYQVICPVISSKISGTFNSAYAAAQRFSGNVTVFDTETWSIAQGYQVLAAARAAAAGKSIAEIVSHMESIRARSHVFLTVDTVEYLRRGGRFERIMPLLRRVVSVLSIKPIIELAAGQLRPAGATRSRAKAMSRIQESLRANLPAEMLIVAHTRIADLARAYARQLAEAFDFPVERIMVAELGPALASHAGPGAIAAGVVSLSEPDVGTIHKPVTSPSP